MNWPVNGSQTNAHPHPPVPQPYPQYGGSPSQNLGHQSYSATYSFAADIRPDPTLENFRSQWVPASSGILTSPQGAPSSSSLRSYGPTPAKRIKSSSKYYLHTNICDRNEIFIAK